MAFNTVFTLRLSNLKAVRVLQHESGSKHLDVRRVVNEKFTKSGIFLSFDEALDMFTVLRNEMPLNRVKEFTLPSTGRRLAVRRDKIGAGLWLNRKASPFSEFTGLYLLTEEFETLTSSFDALARHLIDNGV